MEDDCEHPESENGICSDCGDEVDWIGCNGDQSVFDCNDRRENG